MGDSAINRASDVDSHEVVTAFDKVAADIPIAAHERIQGFFSEDSLKAAQIDRPHIEPAKVGNVISISVLANVAAAKPKLEDPDATPAPAEAVEKEWMGAVSRPRAAQIAIALLSIIAVAEFALLVSRSRTQQTVSTAPATGIVAVESTPPGATIAINGEKRGVTPATLSLRAGEYTMSLTAGDAVRHVPLVVRGGQSSATFYFSDFDGEASSQSPSKLPENAALSANRETAGAKPRAPMSPQAALPPAGAVAGWLSVSGAPVDLQLFEGGVLLGSTQTDRLMLPVGRHVIDAVNTAVGYKTSSTVQVSAGAVTRLNLEVPNGTLNINAIPWAEVAIDGKHLGSTPLGDLSLPVGSHEVVFTHPQLGERRQNVVVTLNGVNRASVNLNQR